MDRTWDEAWEAFYLELFKSYLVPPDQYLPETFIFGNGETSSEITYIFKKLGETEEQRNKRLYPHIYK